MGSFLKFVGKFVLYSMLFLQSVLGVVVFILFIAIGAAILGGVGGGDDEFEVPEGAALVFNPAGVIVEVAPVSDPFDEALTEAFGGGTVPLISVHDVVRTLRAAAEDDRISGLVLDLENTGVSGFSKVDYLAEEIEAFKATGKKVVAVSDSYGQTQYSLAALADTVVAHPFGGVLPTGLGSYRLYQRELFDEKLMATTHVFRVGTYKSAIEPFLRDDMSPEDREARIAYLQPLWDTITSRIDTARELTPGTFDDITQRIDEVAVQFEGDSARGALELGLFDDLLTREAQRSFLIDEFGENEDGDSYNGVSWKRYLDSLDPIENDEETGDIAVVSVVGTIINGSATVGEAAGGDTVASQLRKAREDEDVKAVVLRVDSGGGSAYASEIIRQQVLELKKAGKPVVASMGSVAASGGYWILADADKIFAKENTITGSIGIFGLFQTFERTAEWAGVRTDGVGTAPISAINGMGLGPMPEEFGTVVQAQIEEGYRRFLQIVGEGRDLDTEYVDTIAQGRVWIGTTAKEIGLVDEFGGYDEAIAEAARLAELSDYDVIDFIDRTDPLERFFQSLGAEAVSKTVGSNREGRRPSLIARIVHEAMAEAERIENFNDPNGVYALCEACEIR